MSDIVEFLRAQWAEEERLWLALLAADKGGIDSWGAIGAADEAYSAFRPDPVKEIAAKRRVLDGLIAAMEDDYAPWNEQLIRLLAQPYAGRDGWDEEAWRVE